MRNMLKKILKVIVKSLTAVVILAFLLCISATVFFALTTSRFFAPDNAAYKVRHLTGISEGVDDIFLLDSHGGMLGDGRTFLDFRCNEEAFSKLMAQYNWMAGSPKQSVLQELFSTIDRLQVPTKRQPDLSKGTIMHYAPSEHMFYLVDTMERRAWIIQITR